MGPVGFSIGAGVLAAAAIAAARLKTWYFRGAKDRYTFHPVRLETGPLVSVIIPARNEEAAVGRLLEGVVVQRYRNIEVIVVDDASEDSTARVVGEYAARDNRITLAAAGALPPDWTGKCNACRTGAGLARGEFLLYLDCDVRLEDADVIGGLVALSREQGIDLLSLVPRQVLGSPIERFLLPAVYAIMATGFLPFRRINDPLDAKAAAVGQCLFFRRGAYEAIGGHQAVKGHIAEDMAFAALVKARGLRLVLLDAGRSLSVRMYNSLGEIWSGWTKHLHASAAGGIAGLARIGAVSSLAFLAPPAILVWALISLALGPTFYAGCVLILALGVEVWVRKERLRNYRMMKWPRYYEPLFAPAMVFALVLLAASAVKHALPNGLSWKGRRYSAVRSKRNIAP